MHSFTCNICGRPQEARIELLTRETASCGHCRSSIRIRSIAYLLSMAVHGRALAIPDFPVRRDIVGVGLSDWPVCAKALAEKFDYTNTFFHREPRLDITSPGGAFSNCDFLISSDVFEHVLSPVQRAFDGAIQVLRPGGTLILTVPFTNAAATIEHFEEFAEFQVVRHGEERVVVGRKRDGTFGINSKLVFHGGDGETLEMRVFCRRDVVRHLERAGFTDIAIFAQNRPQWGIFHKDPWSLPIVARKP
jgi:hypothetical protein